MNSLRLYLYWLPCFKVPLRQVLFSHELHPSCSVWREILISQFSMTCILKLQKTHSKLNFSIHKNGLQQFEKSLLNNQKRNNCRRTARSCKDFRKSILLSSAFFAAILSSSVKLAFQTSVLFRLSETKVVNVSVVHVEINLRMDQYCWRKHMLFI